MNASSSIRDQLAGAGRGRDGAVRFATALTVIGALVAVLLLVALLDYEMILPAPIRWSAVGLMAVIFAGGCLRLLWLLRRPTSLKQSALDIEATRPGAGLEVSTAAEYVTGER